MVVSIFIEKPLGFLDRARQVRSLARDQVGIQRVQGFTEGIVVEGERTKGESASGKGDQPDTIAFEAGHEIEDAEPRALEAVGCEILRQHAAGGVHGEQDVDALAFHIAPFVAFLRAGDRGESQQHRQHPETALDVAKPRGEAFG